MLGIYVRDLGLNVSCFDFRGRGFSKKKKKISGVVPLKMFFFFFLQIFFSFNSEIKKEKGKTVSFLN